MRSYRFTRRAFLGSIGGAIGLKLMLENLEAQAQGMTSPPRFLMTHWPVGTLRYHWVPSGSGTSYTTSRILQPFEDAGLREDMIVLYGLKHGFTGLGGGHEDGTPFMTTGANSPGTRDNQGEDDDGCAGGPSWDQILLKNVPDLQRSGAGYANAICDARIDSYETSTQCLSYSYTKRSIASARPGGQLSEATPLLPVLSPVQLYMNLFGNFMPGGSTGNEDAILRALRARKSVLDYALGELASIKLIAPGSEASKIDLHAEAIRKIELQISDQLANPTPSSMGCMAPAAPDPNLLGKTGSKFDYDNPLTNTADDALHEQVGKVHAGIIMAAFQCDLIRVATFQWSPGTNHVSFKGMYPADTNAIYMHHPLSHKVQDPAFFDGSPPTSGTNASIFEFLVNVNTWYNAKTADILNSFKSATDVYGNTLLDHTVVPYVTEVAQAAHLPRSNIPALIFGGKALGMKGGQFQNFQNSNRSHNDVWLSVAQAFLKTSDPLGAIKANETPTFVTTGASPISGLWTAPA